MRASGTARVNLTALARAASKACSSRCGSACSMGAAAGRHHSMRRPCAPACRRWLRLPSKASKSTGCGFSTWLWARFSFSKPSNMAAMRWADCSMVWRKLRASSRSSAPGLADCSSSATSGLKASRWRSGARKSCETACIHSCWAVRKADSSASRLASSASASPRD